MQRRYLGIPASVKFPLREVTEAVLCKKIGRGVGWQRKYYGCTFAYCIALALYEGFERIELYGVELAQQIEYIMQRPSTEFWLGIAVGKGVEVYLPAMTRVLQGPMYGYRWPDVPSAKRDKESISPLSIDEDNVGIWDNYGDGMFPNMLADLGETEEPDTGSEDAVKSAGINDEADA
jgi:hypothetical protein